jgi:hypothetical protein
MKLQQPKAAGFHAHQSSIEHLNAFQQSQNIFNASMTV